MGFKASVGLLVVFLGVFGGVFFFLFVEGHVEGVFLGEVVAFVDAELALGFDAASFAGVFASDEWC